MPKYFTGASVFDQTIERILKLYEQGDRVVVSVSGGKDSTVVMEMALIAAKMANALPLDVVTRDEEIMFPGTYEYLERVAQRPEIRFRWAIARQPSVNVYNRAMPYYWAFDPTIPPDEWVRQPPDLTKTPHSYVDWIDKQSIHHISQQDHYPIDGGPYDPRTEEGQKPGKRLIVLQGVRTSESPNRLMGLYSANSWINKRPTPPTGEDAKIAGFMGKPIYDWQDGDIWKAIRDNGWDYNEAYNVMHRLGIPKRALRIAPPAMAVASWRNLEMARKAWPQWFDRVCRRLPGVRSVATFGVRTVQPARRRGETWEACFWRACVDEAPSWIAERARKVAEDRVRLHGKHATQAFPEKFGCNRCGILGSWKLLVSGLYDGDPFGSRTGLAPVEPEAFRKGAGYWNGKASW